MQERAALRDCFTISLVDDDLGRGARTAVALGWVSLALLSFATLVSRHGEILDLGYRAVLWPVYVSALTRATTWTVLAVVLAVAAIGAAFVARRRSGGAT